MEIYSKYVKRLIDFCISSCSLILLSPLLIYIAKIIKKEDSGDVFYRGERVGQNGKPFKIYKFRTMVMNAEALGGSSTPTDDSRITQIGEFLRKSKLDEIPQLINVFKGDMSLVGPRPQVPWAVNMKDSNTQNILKVRPGITDYASIIFHNEGEILQGLEDPDKGYFELIHPKKTELELKYVDEISFIKDMIIIINTLRVVINIGVRQHDE